MVEFWWELSSWHADSHFLGVSSYGREKASSGFFFFIEGLLDEHLTLMTSFKPNHSLKTLLPNTITLGVSASTYKFDVWGTYMQSVTRAIFVLCSSDPSLQATLQGICIFHCWHQSNYLLDLYPTLSLSFDLQNWKGAVNSTSKPPGLLKSVTQFRVFLTTGIDTTLIFLFLGINGYATNRIEFQEKFIPFFKRKDGTIRQLGNMPVS